MINKEKLIDFLKEYKQLVDKYGYKIIANYDENVRVSDIYDDNNYFDNLIFKERLNKELSKRGVV